MESKQFIRRGANRSATRSGQSYCSLCSMDAIADNNCRTVGMGSSAATTNIIRRHPDYVQATRTSMAPGSSG